MACVAGQKRYWVLPLEKPVFGAFSVSPNHAADDPFWPCRIQHTLCRIEECASPRQRRAVVPGHPIRRRLLQLLRVPLKKIQTLN
jgi:hypothetical protein